MRPKMNPTEQDINYIREMYEKNMMSGTDIAKLLNVDRSSVYYYMKKFKIKSRSFSERQTPTAIEKYKQTSLAKYGVDYCSKIPSFQDNINQTCLKKYGTKRPMQNEKIKDKMKKTCIEKYGTENVFQNEEIKNKSTETIFKKYGVTNVSQNKQIRNKMKATIFKKYGVTNAFQNEQIRNKMKATIFKKYGVTNAFQNEQIRNKMKATMNERYGCDHPAHNKDLFNKKVESSLKYKKYIMPSGKEVYVQGYEDLMLDILLESNDESDICVHKDVPSIKWFDGKKFRFHFPDIYIKSLNRIIEVKSTWTFNKDKQDVLSKQKEAIKQGFSYTIFVLHKKRKKGAKTEILYEI